MGFIHGEKANSGPGFQSFCLGICNTCMKQGISMVNKEDLDLTIII